MLDKKDRMVKYFIRAVLIIALISLRNAPAYSQQMTDEKVTEYVQDALKDGKSQQEILLSLKQKGVTIAQLKRLKTQYEQNKDAGFIGQKVVKNNSRIRQINKKRSNRQVVSFKDKNRKKDSSELSDDENYLDAMQFLLPDSLREMSIKKELDKPQIFGHSLFSNDKLTFSPDINIATPINYQLGPGDEVIIDVWGASQSTIQQKISPDGTIIVENLGPIFLNGLTVAQANEQVKNELSKIYEGILGNNPNSYIRLTLGQTRTIRVNVMGEVLVPGTYQLSAFATVFNALYIANGVNDIGSLRQIKVYRTNKHIATLDIYGYLLKGRIDNDIRLQDNDVIVVPPYQSLVNIVGKVKRPMFYELTPKESMQDLLNYAGGTRGGAYKEKLRVIRKSGNEHQIYTLSPDKLASFTMMDGDSVYVDSVLTTYVNRVQVKGAVYRPGDYELSSSVKTVSDLIKEAKGLKGDAFISHAVMHRQNKNMTITAIALNLEGILKGSLPDVLLKKNDMLFIPSIQDLHEDKTVSIFGEVAFPGIYKYAKNTTIEDLVLQAGGLLESASTVQVDIARRVKNPKARKISDVTAKRYTFALKDGLVVSGEKGFVLAAYDQVYIRKSPGYQKQKNIEIDGEVLYPGKYALSKKNQRISELIKLAGGLTPEAYAKGVRLERKMKPEEVARMRSLLRIAKAGSKDSISAATLDLGTTYYVGIKLEEAMKHPLGNADIVLQEGDKIYVPEFTNTVKINGAVMYPNTVSYKANEKAKYYINMAGGYGLNAKKSRAYVIYMNGTVARLSRSDRAAIQPGCEIVIPTRKKGKGLSIAEILTIGTSTASIATMIATIANLMKK